MSPFGWALRHAGEGVSPGLVKVVWLSSGGRAERLETDKHALVIAPRMIELGLFMSGSGKIKYVVISHLFQ